jgi:hypothetical protein
MRFLKYMIAILAISCVSSLTYALNYTVYRDTDTAKGNDRTMTGQTDVWSYDASHFISRGIFWDSKDRVIVCTYDNFDVVLPNTDMAYEFPVQGVKKFNPGSLAVTFDYTYKGIVQRDSDSYAGDRSAIKPKPQTMSVFFDASPTCVPGQDREGNKVGNYYNCVDEAGEIRVTENANGGIFVLCQSQVYKPS